MALIERSMLLHGSSLFIKRTFFERLKYGAKDSNRFDGEDTKL
jgi:hypothetical protein